MLVTYKDIENLRKNGLKWREIGDYYALPLGRDSNSVSNILRHVYRRKGKTNLKDFTKVSSDFSTRTMEYGDGSTSSEKTFDGALEKMSEKDLLEFHGFNSEDWHIKESVSARKNGKQTSRIRVLPRQFTDISEDKLTKAIKTALSQLTEPKQYIIPKTKDYALVAVLPLYDIHFGREYDMNGVIYNHEDTKRELITNTAQFLEKYNKSDADSLVIVIGQDFFNFDTPAGTTTKGTQQQNSLSWHEMFAQGLALLRDIIEMCRGRRKVKVVYSEGNHDVVLAFCLAQALQLAFSNCSDVEFDVGSEPRKYFAIGKTLIGLSHFYEESKISTVMQSEVPEMWGRSIQRFWITGHVHHLEMYDKDGVVIIRCPSPTFKDSWTEKKGFVGSMQRQIGFLFDTNGMGEMWLLGD